MYSQLEAIDKVRHAGLRLAPSSTYAFAAQLTVVPLVGMEVAQAAVHYPIVFLPAEKGPALPHALLGLTDFNTYLNENKNWPVEYIPALIRQYPFALAKAGEGHVLAVDMAAPNLQTTTGDALISEDGEFTDLLKSAGEFATRLHQQREATAAALNEVDGYGVLVEKNLTIKDNEATRMIGGLRTVDREKLAALDDAALAKWARNGVLEILHHHLASLRHLNAVALASSRTGPKH